MNLANKLTLARLFLALLLAITLMSGHLSAGYIALPIFLIAAITDFCDGQIARRNKTITDFGKIMDPIADKILLFVPLVAFASFGIIAPWMVGVIIAREFIITGMRVRAAFKGNVLASQAAGKQKTVLQFSAVIVVFCYITAREIARSGNWAFWSPAVESGCMYYINVLMWVVVIQTLASGVMYLWQNRSAFARF